MDNSQRRRTLRRTLTGVGMVLQRQLWKLFCFYLLCGIQNRQMRSQPACLTFFPELFEMSPVIQLLKLRVCQPDGCILRYYFFCIQSKFQLTISLNYVILCRGNVLCHDLILPQTETPANPFFGESWCLCFYGAILQRALCFA